MVGWLFVCLHPILLFISYFILSFYLLQLLHHLAAVGDDQVGGRVLQVAAAVGGVVVQVGENGLAAGHRRLDDLCRGGNEVGANEEVDEEGKEEKVEAEAGEGAGDGEVGGQAGQLPTEGVGVDVQAGKHLGDLQRGDGDVHLLRQADAHRGQGVVGVHHAKGRREGKKIIVRLVLLIRFWRGFRSLKLKSTYL